MNYLLFRIKLPIFIFLIGLMMIGFSTSSVSNSFAVGGKSNRRSSSPARSSESVTRNVPWQNPLESAARAGKEFFGSVRRGWNNFTKANIVPPEVKYNINRSEFT